PVQVRTADLEVEPGVAAPPFGAPNRERQVAVVFRRSPRPYQAVYRTARRVVGEPANPYAAALELEGWFRSGAFQYDERPPQIAGVPPLAAFVTQTRRGYCQHFAGAMALMLRYLGIPARVAAGLVAAVVATKLAVRKARYLTRDPRMLARACVCELSDFAADQGAKAPPSATLGELAQLVEAELGVSASAFASAAAEARFGP